MGNPSDTEFVHGVPVAAPPIVGAVLFGQTWADLAFLHWPVRPERVAAMFPAGTEPDVWRDGLTYVGLVPFRMSRAGFGARVPVPFFGDFLEWNVRLYSVDAEGRHGVVFRSLDCTRRAVVALARSVFGIPYRSAAIEAARSAEVAEWQMTRRGRRPVGSRLSMHVGAPVKASELELFLTCRWGMHARRAGRTFWVPNSHPAWPLQSADLLELDDELVAAAGIPVDGPMLRPLWTPGVRTRFGFPHVIGAS